MAEKTKIQTEKSIGQNIVIAFLQMQIHIRSTNDKGEIDYATFGPLRSLHMELDQDILL